MFNVELLAAVSPNVTNYSLRYAICWLSFCVKCKVYRAHELSPKSYCWMSEEERERTAPAATAVAVTGQPCDRAVMQIDFNVAQFLWQRWDFLLPSRSDQHTFSRAFTHRSLKWLLLLVLSNAFEIFYSCLRHWLGSAYRFWVIICTFCSCCCCNLIAST